MRFDAMGLRGEARRNGVRTFVPQGTLQIIETKSYPISEESRELCFKNFIFAYSSPSPLKRPQ